MKTSLFDYDLPPERIAQHSVEPRDTAKLLVIDRKRETFKDDFVLHLPNYLQPGDLLVFNNSKVFKARLHAKKDEKEIELFLLRPVDSLWLGLAKPAKKLRSGDTMTLADGSIVTLIKKTPEGNVLLDFERSTEKVFALTDRIGEVPVPPYVDEKPDSAEKYQTIYAEHRGSVAAPTAGFHFTPRLFQALEEKGVNKAFVTLHVGLGTFRPMKTKTLEEHTMHEEWVDVPEETVRLIEETKKAGKRVIAVGTTVVRSLESFAQAATPSYSPIARGSSSGFTKLFITPGYSFKVIDGLMTNFHLPKSTLLVLVSSFANHELILRAYQHAIDHGYRFYSFGDAMLIT